jgi:hypothetical protein
MAPTIFVIPALMCGVIGTAMLVIAYLKVKPLVAGVAIVPNILCWIFFILAILPWSDSVVWGLAVFAIVGVAALVVHIVLISSLRQQHQKQRMNKRIQERFYTGTE